MKSLIIWLPTGQTMKFEDVQDYEGDPLGYEETIAFNYHGVSTDVRRKAVFMKSRLMGWALEQEEE